MIRLRTILLSNYLYYIILFIGLLTTLLRIVFFSYPDISNTIEAKVSSYTIKNDKMIIISSNRHIIGTYYLNKEKLNIHIGDTYKINGEIAIPNNNGQFNYRNYLKSKKIYYTMNIKSIKKVKDNNNIIFILKNTLIKRLNGNAYLNAFILGDKSLIDEDVKYSYQENGISHLFAISGMHISLLSGIILKILKKIKETKRYLITSSILFIYLLLVGPSPSIIRGILFFYLFSINKIYYLYIKNTNLYIIALVITLLINPFYIYDNGFIYSFAISLSLLLSSKFISSNNYFLGLFKTSIISFISSLPISLYFYCSINTLSILYNLFFVPFISLLVFPLSLLTLFIPILEPIYNLLIYILEKTSLLLSKITIGKIIFIKLNILYYIILIILIFIGIIFINNKKYYLKYIIIILIIHYNIPYILDNDYIKMIDVGQGDSILLYSNNKAVLVDTGGIFNSSNSIIKNKTIPLLKSLGIRKINYLILTHGDYDHLGEALKLIEYYKVDNIIINSNRINYLENKIINRRGDTIISYEGLDFTIGDFYFYQLNSNLNDENDSSQVYYVKYKNINILLTGDASIKTEKNILDNYNLPEIDILKVGHHGSKTSTSEELLEATNPKIALISAGKDNKFNHPNKETLIKLNKYKTKYYITAELGTITFDLNKYKISTSINN